jgi:hypothetical protein
MGEEKAIRTELLVASPPTSKCQRLINMMEKFVEKYPGKLRLDIYYAGSKPFVVPTKGYQRDPDGKRRKVPSAYINGKKIASNEVPERKKVSRIIEEECKKN